ncbi:ATP-binding protein [Streptomyces olivaceus]
MDDSEGGCAEWVFPAAPDAVRTSRSVVRRTLEEWRLGSVGDLAALPVGELAANALRSRRRPRRRPPGARPRRSAGVPLVEVSAPLPACPESVGRPDGEDGRGVQLVASTARRWGTRSGGTGKTVWFELTVPPQP